MKLDSDVQEFIDILTWSNTKIGITSRLGLISANKLAEDVYARLLNALYDWSLENKNRAGRNEEAVDLEDEKNHLVVQVTATCSREKINGTLKSDKVDEYQKSGYSLKFAFVGFQHEATKVKAADGWTIHDLHRIGFDRQRDVLFTEDLANQFKSHDPAERAKILELVHGDIGVPPTNGRTGLSGYYEWVCGRFYGDKGSFLYGDVPLSECYIEPTIKMGNEELLSARKYIESCVDRKESWANEGSISIICGEPGHGKTSLCQKAVCDFFMNGWLADKVRNVFSFSLNPARTKALDRDELNFNSLLSWGDEYDRTEPEKKIDVEDCQDALVLLDGFDELLDSYPTDMEDFIEGPIIKFVRNTGAHVIITTRSMVIGPDIIYSNSL